MGLMDKVKNLFTEEVIIEDKPEEVVEKPAKKKKQKRQEEPIQKEVIKVEIPSPKQSRSEISDYDFVDDDLPVNAKKEEPKEEYKFPFFDDDDFDTFEVKEEPKEEKKPYKPEVYNPPKEEKKVFKPSPIISPVFGFMDKDYKKEVQGKQNREYDSKRATVDEIRDKAFGGLESDIEDTLFGTGRVLFDEDDNAIDIDVLEEENAIDNEDTYDEDIVGEKPRHENIKDEDDLTDLLEAEMAKPEKNNKSKKKPRKISDKELFNLIDSMYEGEIK